MELGYEGNIIVALSAASTLPAHHKISGRGAGPDELAVKATSRLPGTVITDLGPRAKAPTVSRTNHLRLEVGLITMTAVEVGFCPRAVVAPLVPPFHFCVGAAADRVSLGRRSEILLALIAASNAPTPQKVIGFI